MSAYIFDEKTGTVAVPCRMCGKRKTFSVNVERFKRWQRGEALIQNVLSNVSVENRELLISNTCGECFASLFPKEEDEEECIYHAMVFDPEISMEKEVISEAYMTAMKYYHVGDKVRHTVSAPGIGFVEYLITRMDEKGIWGVVIANTVRELTPEEVE